MILFLWLFYQFSSSFGNGCGGDSPTSSHHHHLVLVGNKTDQVEDRMVSYGEGEKRSRDLGCDLFFEISVREEADAARRVVESLYNVYKQQQQIEFLYRELKAIKEQASSGGPGGGSLKDEIPPHY